MQNKCPACQKLLQIPDTFAGKRIKCPLCSHAFVAGGAETPQTGNTTGGEADSANLLQLIASYQREIDKSMRERDEAMEMIDGFFQLFLQRGENSNLTLSEQQEYRDTAQKLFELQKKFPLLSGMKSILQKCEEAIRHAAPHK